MNRLVCLVRIKLLIEILEWLFPWCFSVVKVPGQIFLDSHDEVAKVPDKVFLNAVDSE